MSDLPNLAICMVTYKRTAEALRTIQGVADFLSHPKEKRAWFVNDDGSPSAHTNAIQDALARNGEKLTFMNTERFGGSTYHCGKGWNLTLGNAHQYSDYVLWLEDDWELRVPFDLTDYLRLLTEREDVGLLRLGGLAVGSDVSIVGHGGIHYLHYLKTTPYAYSGNPLLRHARFVNAYGWFSEEHNPGEIELNYDWRFRTTDGPQIWRPARIDPWGAFGHLGTDKSYE